MITEAKPADLPKQAEVVPAPEQPAPETSFNPAKVEEDKSAAAVIPLPSTTQAAVGSDSEKPESSENNTGIQLAPPIDLTGSKKASVKKPTTTEVGGMIDDLENLAQLEAAAKEI